MQFLKPSSPTCKEKKFKNKALKILKTFTEAFIRLVSYFESLAKRFPIWLLCLSRLTSARFPNFSADVSSNV